ncbi:hypothetical protein JW930_03615 [Candidatus Woesearchaeota archaeon]|nr:hypothetical protein [Candidatus Woesearchaeota archaeon]
MQKIKCKKGKCWDENSIKEKVLKTCKEVDVVCETEADLIEEQIGGSI